VLYPGGSGYDIRFFTTAKKVSITLSGKEYNPVAMDDKE
jgi:hypothetical protein